MPLMLKRGVQYSESAHPAMGRYSSGASTGLFKAVRWQALQ
jgi:hypothetical protein